jgi:hypothetical protein
MKKAADRAAFFKIILRYFVVAAGDTLAFAEPEAEALGDMDVTGVNVAETRGVGVSVGFSVTSTVTKGVGVGADGLHAVNNTANNNTTAATAKSIFLFI